MKRIINLLVATCACVTLNASAGVIGALSWDESSTFITDASSDNIYVQLGLHKSLNYFQVVDLLANDASWSAFQIANQSDAYNFANSALAGSGVSWTDAYNANVAESQMAMLNQPFSDGTLGNNFDDQRDFFFFESDFQNRLGLVTLDSRSQTIKLNEANDTVYFSNNFARTGTSRESDWVTYLLVKRAPDGPTVSPVPEESTLLLFAFGILGLFGMRKK